jgi:hypothetical protein
MARTDDGRRVLPVHFGPWQTAYWWFGASHVPWGREVELRSHGQPVFWGEAAQSHVRVVTSVDHLQVVVPSCMSASRSNSYYASHS